MEKMAQMRDFDVVVVPFKVVEQFIDPCLPALDPQGGLDRGTSTAPELVCCLDHRLGSGEYHPVMDVGLPGPPLAGWTPSSQRPHPP
jgi:hypothetical protein